jgi:hypothetical protein
MSDDRAPVLSAVSVGVGALLAGLLPSEWPWYFALPTVVAVAVAVYFAAKLGGRPKG